jgi:hypothetical protein
VPHPRPGQRHVRRAGGGDGGPQRRVLGPDAQHGHAAPRRLVQRLLMTEAAALLRPIANAVAASGVVPFPNPVGLGWPPPE